MEFVEKGDLLEYLNGSDDLSENEIRTLFQQLVLGMAHCHKEKVVHRDIKCENILLDAKGRLKITGKMVTDQYCAATSRPLFQSSSKLVRSSLRVLASH